MDLYDGPDFRCSRERLAGRPVKPWLMIWFRCCHAYGRIYRNRQATAYVGKCPRCGAEVRARIGRHGTSRRMFEAR